MLKAFQILIEGISSKDSKNNNLAMLVAYGMFLIVVICLV